MLKKSLLAETHGKANDSQIKVIGDVRITVLEEKLIRVEKEIFTDLPSFTVFNRQFDAVKFEARKTGDIITVETEGAVFVIKNGKPYSAQEKPRGTVQLFGKAKNLKGTCRTLDGSVGRMPLGDGLITKDGAYLLDDSGRFLLDEGGHFVKRQGGRDYYCFAFGKNRRETLRAFFAISSPTPLVPRFALGVWWSRYHAYSDTEYIKLMDKFKAENVPLTVATVDMDWHWVDLKKQFGISESGWTGYSWNTRLFPDYKQFLNELTQRNLKITLNLHPADGIRSFEDMYEETARAVGIDPKTKESVKFSCKNDDFWNAYFDKVHKPYEKDGVDFWWIDWQQGKKSDIDGLDPLLALNHYHYLDNAENGKIPLILSRYAGLGSHRYPLGFSGDTAMTHSVLDFQPYFTANAANAAYFWWSHDIGGHHFGYRDDELYLRWIQFGTFAPILRLHSTSNDLLGKEPWKYKKEVYSSAKKYLRLRHRLIPYIFTMDYRSHKDSIALCEPMYYAYPDEKAAYKVPNEYFFGSELIVVPITKKTDKITNKGFAKAWIPSGEYTDIFTLKKYRGPMNITLCRELEEIPVLAKSGAIIPLSADGGNSAENPKKLELWTFCGNNSFTLYEDNGKTDFEEHNVKTRIENSFDKTKKAALLTVKAPDGDASLIVKNRQITAVFKEICSAQVKCSATHTVTRDENGALCVSFVQNGEDVEIKLSDIAFFEKPTYSQRVINCMSRMQGETVGKTAKYQPLKGKTDKNALLRALRLSRVPKTVKQVIYEELMTD